MTTTEKLKIKCPDCGKRGTLTQIIQYRTSLTVRNVKYFCGHIFKKGTVDETCSFKVIIRINRGEDDYIGEVS